MNKIILASHGGMSAGVKDTVQMVLGDLPNLYTAATERDETESILTVVRRLLDGFEASDQVYILTDVLGGSVNNDMMILLGEYPDLTIICGMNLSLVLALAMVNEPLSPGELENIIGQAREQIVNCTELLRSAAGEEEEDIL
ncbi:PTS sugar transporter subunit IIA [Hungatella sp.]|uniref:PTS sugar transporter subunit IIA n=1 Tax=Hungatella sp. TaxID=2613924 RepID=UPI003AB172DD